MDTKQQFLDRIYLSTTLAAAFQRSGVYSPAITQQDRQRIRKGLFAQLKKIAKLYDTSVDDDTHVQNINSIITWSQSEHSDVLNNGRFLFGVAQKALNLYLKFLWCEGLIPEPPHCPIDRIVISALPIPMTNWTTLDSVEKYLWIVDAARAEAFPSSIAQWELRLWNGAA